LASSSPSMAKRLEDMKILKIMKRNLDFIIFIFGNKKC
jgi:hypothetical protein